MTGSSEEAGARRGSSRLSCEVGELTRPEKLSLVSAPLDEVVVSLSVLRLGEQFVLVDPRDDG